MKSRPVKDPEAVRQWADGHDCCQVCGIDEHKARWVHITGLQTHHIIKAGRSDEPCNLLRVCQRSIGLSKASPCPTKTGAIGAADVGPRAATEAGARSPGVRSGPPDRALAEPGRHARFRSLAGAPAVARGVYRRADAMARRLTARDAQSCAIAFNCLAGFLPFLLS